MPTLKPTLRRGGSQPLSFSQQRLWFIDKMTPGSTAYNLPSALNLHGHLNVDALKQSFTEIVARHETLRTVFREEHGVGVQVVLDKIDGIWSLENLTATPENDRESISRQRAATEARHTFNLQEGPLIRVTLLRFSATHHTLLFNMHHIITDGWSRGVLIRELVNLYHTCVDGSPPTLPALPIQYGDYAVWQQEWLSGETLEAQVNFWKETLEDIPERIYLPVDRPYPKIQSFRGSQYRSRVSAEVSEAIHNLGRQREATLFMTLLSAYGVLLNRLSNQNKVVIGTPVANRPQPALETLIGFFVNTLPLCLNFQGNPTFNQLLAAVKNNALEAFTHQDLPFEKLVEELQPQRSLSHTPIFQVMFSLQTIDRETIDLPGVEVQPMAGDIATTKSDLTLFVRENAGFDCIWEYNTDLFDEATIHGFATFFENLLRDISRNANTPIGSLAMLKNDDSANLITTLNSLEAPEADARPLHEQVLAWSEKNPDRLALVSKSSGRSLTYGQLATASKQVTALLLSQGIGSGDIVGIHLERDLDFVVAMVGIVQAGAAYVPLEANLPRERFNFIVVETKAKAVLTQDSLRNKMPKTSAAPIRIEDAENLSVGDLPQVHAMQTAYVLYTSGSTGKPKGVMISHHAVSTLIAALEKQASLLDGSNASLMGSFSFDVTILETFYPLSRNATVHLVDSDTVSDPQACATLLVDNKIHYAYIPPGILSDVVDHLQQSQGNIVLRNLIIGVEPITQKLVSRLRSIVPGIKILNGYGPTEATVCATASLCENLDEPERRLPIGKPLPGYQGYIVDQQLNLVPKGVEGEYAIGGQALAMGYLYRPGRTAQQFVPNPFANSGERLYLTGDLVCQLHSGEIEFRGRIDHQVKIRGYRVELGEIEMILNQHPQVQQAAVIPTNPANLQIVAYVAVEGAARETQPLDQRLEQTLKDWLARHVPNYMIPSRFIALHALPSLASGKINRKALPDPDGLLTVNISKPRTPTQETLHQIWSDLLGLSSIDIQANFFSVGGHSLLAIRLMAAIREEFGIDLPLTTLFKDSTIEQLAERLDSNLATNVAQPLVPLSVRDDKPVLFCVHPVGGTIFAYIQLAEKLASSLSFYGLQSPAVYGQDVPKTFQGMAKLYVEHIKRIQSSGPYRLAGWSLGGLIAMEMARLLKDQGERVVFLGLIDTHAKPKGQNPNETRLLADFALEMSTQTGVDLPDTATLEQLATYGLHSPQSEPILKRIMPGLESMKIHNLWDAYRHMRQALSNYTPTTYQGDVVLFRATATAGENLTQAWQDLVSGRLQAIEIPGTHHSIFKAGNVAHLAEAMRGFCFPSQ